MVSPQDITADIAPESALSFDKTVPISEIISWWILVNFSSIIKNLKFITHFNRWSDLTDKYVAQQCVKKPLKRLLYLTVGIH